MEPVFSSPLSIRLPLVFRSRNPLLAHARIRRGVPRLRDHRLRLPYLEPGRCEVWGKRQHAARPLSRHGSGHDKTVAQSRSLLGWAPQAQKRTGCDRCRADRTKRGRQRTRTGCRAAPQSAEARTIPRAGAHNATARHQHARTVTISARHHQPAQATAHPRGKTRPDPVAPCAIVPGVRYAGGRIAPLASPSARTSQRYP